MQTDFLQFIFQAINNLLTQNLGFFDAMGQNLFRSFATILVVWYGVKSALSAASGKHLLHFDNFASLLLTISFGFAMVNYYSTPIPGVGVSFHNLVTDEAQFLSNKINQAELQTVVSAGCRLRIPHGLSRLGRFPRHGNLRHRDDPACCCPGHRHCCHRLRIHRHRCLRPGRADLHSVLYRSEDGVALLGLVPLLHPICLLPSHRRQPSFTSSEISCSERSVLPPGGAISTTDQLGWFPVLFITFLASIYVLLKIPALTNHIFSGTSGGSSAVLVTNAWEAIFG